MSGSENGQVRLDGGRTDLVGRLRSRRGEIEEAILAGVWDGVSDDVGGVDAEHAAGLRAAVAALVDYGLAGIEQGEEQRRAERVRRLLAGERLDTAGLGYELDGWHVGVIATGPGAQEALQGLVAVPELRLLVVSQGEETVWAWLGGQRKPAMADLECWLVDRLDAGVSLAVGEPGRGLEGWRLTHRQARAALLVALRRPGTLTRYAGNMLVAAALQDETLGRSLREIYLAPLASRRDGGAVLRETLREYFAAERNTATAAHRLGVDRHTIKRRLNTIEQRLGRLLHTCQAELEVALRLEELDDGGDAGGAGKGSSAR